MAITFNPPAVPLGTVTELALDAALTADPSTWVWTDVTDKVRHSRGVVWQSGRADQWSTTDETSAELLFDNTDGDFSRHNPFGAYYGQLRKNTPIRSGFDAGEGFYYPVKQYVNDWPDRWDISQTDITVPVKCSGVRTRLAQGAVERSALLRTLTSQSPDAHYPIEEGSDSSSVASSVGGPSLMTRSATALGGSFAIPGSAASVNLSEGGAVYGPIGIAPSIAASWEVELSFGYDELPTDTASLYPICCFLTPGSDVGFWGVWLQVDAPYPRPVVFYWATGTGLVSVGAPGLPVRAGVAHNLRIKFEQVGSDIVVTPYLDGTTGGDFTVASNTLWTPTYFEASSTFYADLTDNTSPSGFGFPFEVVAGPAGLAHVAFFTPMRGVGVAEPAATTGFVGELAHVRMARVCDEEGVRFATSATDSVAMGPQPRAAPLDVLDDCAKVDMGVLYQDDFGLAYQGTDERLNPVSALSISFAQLGEPPEPDDSNVRYRNRWTVTRPGGSSATESNDEGIDQNGLYDDSTQSNVELDTDVDDQAGWRTNRDSVDVPRWPGIFVDFAAVTARPLISGLTTMGFGACATLTNPVAPQPPDDRLVFIEGTTGFFTPLDLHATFLTSPADAYVAGVLADDTGDTATDLGYLASDGSTVRVAVDDNDTSLVIDPNGFWWTSLADDYDPDIRLRIFPADTELYGEEIAVSGVTDTSVTFVSVGTVAHANNASVTPGLPAGMATNDGMFMFAAFWGTGGTINDVTGWERLVDFGNVALFGRVYPGSGAAPTVSFSGGSGGWDTSAQICAFRGTPLDVTEWLVSAGVRLNPSAQNITVPEMQPRFRRQLMLALGWKQDDWTSVLPPTGFTEIDEQDTTGGNDQGITWAYQIQTTATNVTPGVFTVTGGAGAVSRGMLVAVQGGYQTLAVSARNVNGAARSWAVGDRVEVAQPLVLTLTG